MNKLNTLDFRNLAILFFTTILSSVYYGKINYTVAPYATQDLSWYLRMAVASPNLDPGVTQPFAFRILPPFLVGLLPISEPLGFLILSIVFSICVACLFYYMLRYVGISSNVSLVVVILALLNRYVFGVVLWNYFHVGVILSLAFVIILFLAMWENRWFVFGVALALGIMTREIAILMVPVAFIYLIERKQLSLRWRQVAAAILPGLVIFVLIRLFVPIGGGTSLLEALAIYSSKLYTPESLFRGLINTFLPFTLIPLIFFRTTLEFFGNRKYLLMYLAVVYLSTTFGSNEERLVAPTFIVFFMLLGVILDSARANKWTFSILLAAGFLSSLHHTMGIWLLPDAWWTRTFVFGSAICVTLYMYFLKRTARSQEAAGMK